jgi:signal transduction histidine kinase
MVTSCPYEQKDAMTPQHGTTHPLELFAPFRRWRPSPLRNLAFTLVWNALLGVALALLAWTMEQGPFLPLLGAMLLTANVIGLSIHAALTVLLRVVPPVRPGRHSLAMRICRALLTCCCAVFGLAVSHALLGGHDPFAALRDGTVVRLLPTGVVIALVMVAILATGERRLAREMQVARQQEQMAEAARLLAEARLRTLQAQIEPHFLYNTLANVVSLIGADPERARRMLERLIDFLRASLSASRADRTTLGAELDLAGAYLDLLAVRMGARLRWRIDADDACRALPLAPMLVQPLVENAIMHGLEPRVEGGEIVVRARATDNALCIEVADDGMGLAAAEQAPVPRPGGGVGLSNLRERLRSLHGALARLELIDNPARGVTSRLVLPREPHEQPE